MWRGDDIRRSPRFDLIIWRAFLRPWRKLSPSVVTHSIWPFCYIVMCVLCVCLLHLNIWQWSFHCICPLTDCCVEVLSHLTLWWPFEAVIHCWPCIWHFLIFRGPFSWYYLLLTSIDIYCDSPFDTLHSSLTDVLWRWCLTHWTDIICWWRICFHIIYHSDIIVIQYLFMLLWWHWLQVFDTHIDDVVTVVGSDRWRIPLCDLWPTPVLLMMTCWLFIQTIYLLWKLLIRRVGIPVVDSILHPTERENCDIIPFHLIRLTYLSTVLWYWYCYLEGPWWLRGKSLHPLTPMAMTYAWYLWYLTWRCGDPHCYLLFITTADVVTLQYCCRCSFRFVILVFIFPSHVADFDLLSSRRYVVIRWRCSLGLCWSFHSNSVWWFHSD